MPKNYSAYLKAQDNQGIQDVLDKYSVESQKRLSKMNAEALVQSRTNCEELDTFYNAIKSSLPSDVSEVVGRRDVYRTFLEEFAISLDVFSRYEYPTQGNSEPTHHFGIRPDFRKAYALGERLKAVSVFSTASPDVKLRSGDKIDHVFDEGTQTWFSIESIFEDQNKYDLNWLDRFFLSSVFPEMRVRVNGNDQVIKALNEDAPQPPLATARLEGEIIIAELLNFDEGASRDLRQALLKARSLSDRPIKGVVLDFRYNSGGFDSEAEEVLGLFIRSGELYHDVGRNFVRKPIAQAGWTRDQDAFFSEPLVVLVNRFSASNGEVVPWVLQSLGRAVVIGEKTFGKAIGQYVFEFSLGSLIGGQFKLTQNVAYNLQGQTIHGTGIMPDISVKDFDFEQRALESSNTKNRAPQSIHEYALRRKSPVLSFEPRVSEAPKAVNTLFISAQTKGLPEVSKDADDVVLDFAVKLLKK